MSAKELNIGDYVRTIYGIKKITDIICGQDIRFDNTNGFDEDLLNYHDFDGISKNSHTWEEIVIGEPKENIIDLIEVGDTLKLYSTNQIQQVLAINEKEIDLTDYVYYDLKKSKQVIKEDIEWVITHEQIEQMKYKVGE